MLKYIKKKEKYTKKVKSAQNTYMHKMPVKYVIIIITKKLDYIYYINIYIYIKTSKRIKQKIFKNNKKIKNNKKLKQFFIYKFFYI